MTSCASGNPLTVLDLNATGEILWQQAAAEVNGYGYICYPAPIAVRSDGVAFIAEPTNAGLPSLTVAYPDGSVGGGQFPPSMVGTTQVQCCVGPPMVNIDGTAYLEYEVRTTNNNVITSDNLYLYNTTNGSSTVLSTTTQNEALLPGPIIPDGQGGILATWTISPSNPPVPQYPYQIVDVSAGVVGTPYNLPLSPTTVTFGQSPALVLGQSGVAFATDSTDTVNGPVVASFNVASGSVNWTYQAAPADRLSIIEATSDGGVTIDDLSAGILQLSATGSVGTPAPSALQGAVPLDLGTWVSSANGMVTALWSPDGTSGIPTTVAQSVFPTPGGNTRSQHAPPFCQVAANNCVLAPSADKTVGSFPPGTNQREVTYEVFSLQNGTLTPMVTSNTSVQVQGTKIAVLESNPTNPDSGICGWSTTSVMDTFTCQELGGTYTDVYSVGTTGTNTVLQQFFADRGQVQVFWPTDQFNSQGFPIKVWYGAWSQNATTNATLGGVITQNSPMQNGASCTSGCSPTQANNTN